MTDDAMDMDTKEESTTAGVDAMNTEDVVLPVTEEVEEEEEDIEDLETALETAQTATPQARIPILQGIIRNMEKTGPKATQLKERAVYDLVRAHCEITEYAAVVTFLADHEDTFLKTVSKAKTAKLVRQIMDIVSQSNASLVEQEKLARSILEWTIAQKRSFLRQRVQTKLASILYHQERYTESLTMIDALLQELKKLDDKQLLVETHLLESQLLFALRNIPKSKAALTASRTAANAIYVTPALQAAIDLQSGTLHTKEGDYTTAHSYFLEAFEQLDQMNDHAGAMQSLKYMMLCKILASLRKALSLGAPVVIEAMVTAKQAVQYAGLDLTAMQAVARATESRNLKQLEQVLRQYPDQLAADLLIQHHLDLLQEQLLESNLLRIIQPYSCVEIVHVAECIELDVAVTERKLSQMILDGNLSGILDQGAGQLHVYEDHVQTSADALEKGLQIVHNMDSVVTSLFDRSKALGTLA
jgi:26S proteasome regulatory subunit N6